MASSRHTYSQPSPSTGVTRVYDLPPSALPCEALCSVGRPGRSRMRVPGRFAKSRWLPEWALWTTHRPLNPTPVGVAQALTGSRTLLLSE